MFKSKNQKKTYQGNALVASLSAILVLSSIPLITYSGSAEANSTCRVRVSTGNLNQAVDQYCANRADVTRPDPNAERGSPGWIPYFFENPDECDLGISFPSLFPNINIDISKLNSCEILKAVSSNAVEQVNKRFTEIENNVREATGGDIDESIDLNDPVRRRAGGG